MILRQTDLSAFRAHAEQARGSEKKLAPVVLEVTEDMMTPVLAYLTLQRPGKAAFLFESVTGGESTSRWSYLGINPFRTLIVRGTEAVVYDRDRKKIAGSNSPRQLIAEQLEAFSTAAVPGYPPFCGGLVGNIGYDAVRLVEPSIPEMVVDTLELPDITLMYFDCIIAFDHVYKTIFLIKLVDVTTGDDDKECRVALAELNEVHEQLLRPRFHDLKPGNPINGVSSNMSSEQFVHMVERCKEYITAGDAFQIVVSQQFSCQLSVDPFTVYRCLRQTNPSPYLFFLNFGDWQMIGSSPERMVQVINGTVTISPIAGTRPRGNTDDEDATLAAELLADPKERAEHVMLIDLARNDVGRVCKPGSVEIPTGKMMYIEKYSTVMHIVSDVTGKLKTGIKQIEALWASLPAGTLSGAPKIRAMQIIAELEPTRRGPYGGCVGFLGFDGNILTAIVIRTAVVKNGSITWQAGAGIVRDSIPGNEYVETNRKSASIRRALVLAGNTTAEGEKP